MPNDNLEDRLKKGENLEKAIERVKNLKWMHIGASAGAASGVLIDRFLRNFVEPPTSNDNFFPDALLRSIVTGALFYASFAFLTNVTPRRARDWPKVQYHFLRRDYESLEGLLLDPTDVSRIRMKMHAANGNYAKMIEESLFFLDMILKHDVPLTNAFHYLGAKFSMPIYNLKARANPNLKNIVDAFGTLVYTTSDINKIRDFTLKIPDKNNSIPSLLLCADILNYVGPYHNAKRLYLEALERIMKDKSEFREVGDGRNETLTYSDPNTARYVFKRSRIPNKLKREFIILSYHHENILNYAISHGLGEDFRRAVVFPLIIFEESDGMNYMVTRLENLPTAESALDKINPEGRDMMIKRILANLAIITGLAHRRSAQDDRVLRLAWKDAYIPGHDPLTELRLRLISRLGGNEYFGRFVDSFNEEIKERMNNVTSDKRYFFLSHGDMYLHNTLSNGMIYDFENAIMARFMRDPAQLLESQHVKDYDVVSYFRFYRTELEGWSGINFNSIFSEDLFHLYRISNAICSLGSLLAVKHDPKKATFMFNRALELMPDNGKLKPAFKDYITKTPSYKIIE